MAVLRLSVISSIENQLADIQVEIHLWIEYERTCGGQEPNFNREAEKKKNGELDRFPSSAIIPPFGLTGLIFLVDAP